MSDTAPDTQGTTVRDHAFVPNGEWWRTCRWCGLGEASHLQTTQPPGGWPPDYGKTGNAEPEDPGPEPELPLPSPHEINLMDVMYGQYGEMCSRCGGMMQRTGSCLTCSSCGENTGCG